MPNTSEKSVALCLSHTWYLLSIHQFSKPLYPQQGCRNAGGSISDGWPVHHWVNLHLFLCFSMNTFIKLVQVNVSRWQYCTFFTKERPLLVAWRLPAPSPSTVTGMSLVIWDVPSHLIQKPDVSKVILDHWRCENTSSENSF